MDDEYDIIVDNLDKTFDGKRGSTPALKGVSFKVKRANLFCLVGPSGCGKSTLLRILLGIENKTAGVFTINEKRRNRSSGGGIAYVQQTSQLLPWRTLLQNATLGIEIDSELKSEEVTSHKIDRIKRQISDYGLDSFENALPAELSGGMKQRVDIIRVLESRPKILLCDEPFSAIDFVTRLELSIRFKKMCQIYGITTLFVTHNIEEAIFLGDVVAVMSARPGRIISMYEPSLSVGSDDAVKCREAPEFYSLFRTIWNDLKANHDE